MRFDKISRAFYYTTPSVPIRARGRRRRKVAEDVIRAVQLCRKHRCPLTMRGGGTSQGGQTIGAGLQVDTSKYFNRVLEVNVAERWARIEPGIVLDELNASLRPHGLRFAPDISTANRATIGGMMANNSSGARSVYYGKTIDHVIAQHWCCRTGRRAFPTAELAGAREASAGYSLEATVTWGGAAIAAASRRNRRRYPKILRGRRATLSRLVRSDEPFTIAKLIVGGGTLGSS